MAEGPPSDLALLAPFDPCALDDDPSTVCALSPDLRIRYVNRAWSRFAEENGALWRAGEWGVGTRFMSAVPEVLRPFYEALFDRAHESHKPVLHDYECSSPTTHRRFRMQVLPCDSGALLVVHSLLRESTIPHVAAEGSFVEARYRGEGGMISQCGHCRRVRATDVRRAWEWVPELVREPLPGTSHGLCRVCRAHYFAREER